MSLALASNGAFGLGLGEIQMQSALNQPMSAEIPLTEVTPGELDGMIVQLASEDAFARAGINLSDSLADLQFRVDQSSGSPVIRIESSQPVGEPFLNFLLEVDWPQGRVVREYTVLLDPPVFISPTESSRNNAADQPAVVQGGEGAVVAPTPIERSSEADFAGVDVNLSELEDAPSEPVLTLEEATSLGSIADNQLLDDTDNTSSVTALTDSGEPNTAAIEQLANTERPSVTADASESTQNNAFADPDEGAVIVSLDDLGVEPLAEAGNEIEVASGDTLFEIANSLTPPGASVQQMMMALLAANESAFINGNINLVRAGSILRIPASDQATLISQDQALAAVAEQSQLWQDYRDSLRANTDTQITQNITDTENSPEIQTPVEEAPLVQEDVELVQEIVVQEPVEDVAVVEVTEPAESIEPEPVTENLSEEERLSAEALEILEAARRELEGAAELSIVADNASSNSVASATADETADSDKSSRIGKINFELQMAREEYAAARMRSEDLSDKATDLESTSSSLAAIVSLRQNEIAQLENQLIAAKEAAAAQEAAAQLEAEAAEQREADAIAQREAEVLEAAAQQEAEALAQREAEALAEREAAELAALTEQEAEAEREALEALAQQETADAQNTLEEAEQSVVAEATDSLDTLVEGANDSSDTAVRNVTETVGALTDTAQDAGDSALALVEEGAAEIGDASGEAVEGVSEALNASGEAVESGVNALAESGQSLDNLESIDEDSEVVGAVTDANPDGTDELGNEESIASVEQDKSWFQELSESPVRMAITAIGGLSFLGILGTLLFRRKRDDEDEYIQTTDERQFEREPVDDLYDAPAAALATAADPSDDYNIQDEFEGFATPGLSAGNTSIQDAVNADAAIAQDGSKDEVLSEVEVYLAYGLHSQAEEMLLKATDAEPDNSTYAEKLLETYHAQGNVQSFHNTALDYHQRFGRGDSPQWPAIASMGLELMPGEALYSQAEANVPAMASDLALEEAELSSVSSGESVSSVTRSFSDGNIDSTRELDATAFMDESIDPAFIFDESDLEITGDLSRVVEESAAIEEDASLDFPSMEDVDNQAPAAVDGVDTSMFDLDSALEGANSVDNLQDTVDDLTLDLDQLSGDLELDSEELLSSDIGDIELSDLNEDSNSFSDSAADAGGEDMEGMMDLAKAYLDIGDNDSATSTLDEIVKSGSPAQVSEAEILLRNIS